MADEPVGTSTNYDPYATYTPPVGRLPVLGKARAEIDRLRGAMANDLNQIENRDLAQVDNNAKITAEITALVASTVREDAKSVSDIAAQDLKSVAESNLLDQKTISEEAQTTNVVDGRTIFNPSTGATEGTIGEQRALFAKQKDAFDRDAEQKMAKIMVDNWNVRTTIAGTGDSTAAGLDDAQVDQILDIAKVGVGGAATTFDPPTGFLVLPGSLQNVASWNAVPGANSYNLYWSLSSPVTTGDNKITDIDSDGDLEYIHTGLSAGVPIYYKMSAVNTAEETLLSAEQSATPTA